MAAGLLEGKVAVISGIGPGMGRDIALLFAEHGADVVLGARTLERCEAVAEEVRAFGGRAEPVRLDVTITTWPPPRSIIAGTTALVIWSVPQRLTSIVARHSSSKDSSKLR